MRCVLLDKPVDAVSQFQVMFNTWLYLDEFASHWGTAVHDTGQPTFNRFSKHLRLATAAIAALLIPSSAAAKNFWAATNGTATGTGTLSRPWDLKTAFFHPLCN
jgi:hypothetical protein